VPLRLSVYRYQPERRYQLNNERSKEIGYAATNEAEWGNDWRKGQFALLVSRQYTIAPGTSGWQTLPVQLDTGVKDALNDDDRLLFVLDRRRICRYGCPGSTIRSFGCFGAKPKRTGWLNQGMLQAISIRRLSGAKGTR
jgi:hypothetical protein